MAIVIGVDIGTTSTKVVAFDQKGRAKASTNHGYPLIQTQPDMAEEAPEAIFNAVCLGLREVVSQIDASEVRGVSFSAAMHSVIVMDDQNQPLTRVLTWADNRGAKFAEQLRDTPQGRVLFAHTGVPIHPMSPLIKLMWLNHAMPGVMAQAAHVIGIKDYVWWRFFGEYVQDYSLANATGLFDLKTQDWFPQALALAGVSTDQLPRLVAPTYHRTDMQVDLGLPQETPVFVGESDGVLSNLGVAAQKPGTVALTIGTSAAIRTVVNQPVVDPGGRLFTYYLAPGRYVVGGPVNNGGVVWQWAQNTFLPQGDLPALEQLITPIKAGADGLLFLPYLGGERAPLWDADARGSFIGLTKQTNEATMARAVLEGLCFNLKAVLEMVSAVAGQPTVIHATGGFARSELWKQMLCDILNVPIKLPDSFESSALGAAVIAMQALGMIDALDDVQHLVGSTTTLTPGPNAAEYQRLWPIWQEMNAQLAGTYQALANFQRQ
jgi:gluconokinase